MKFQKHWYLGFLGFVGVFEFPALIEVFQVDGTWWGLTGALWFLWFLYFIPEFTVDESGDHPSPNR